jgi:hypothetical protein
MKNSQLFKISVFILILIVYSLKSDTGSIFKSIDEHSSDVGRYEMARMELENGIIHTTWMAKAGETTPAKIIYRRSLDNGQTFEQQIDIMTPQNELESFKSGFAHQMLVDGNNIYVITIGGTTAPQGGWSEGLFITKSNDGGKTFSSPTMLTEPKQYFKIDFADIQIDNGDIYILTVERFNPNSYGNTLIFKSTDLGNTFEEIYVEDANESKPRELLVKDGEIHVLLYKSYYYYGFNFGVLELLTSSDGGNNFTKTEISKPIGDEERHRALVDFDGCTENNFMAKENGKLYILWHELPVDGDRRIMLSVSSNNGVSFETKGITGYEVDDITALGSIFDISVTGNNVNILQRRGGTGSMSHWLTHSSDGGKSFSPLQQIDIGWSFNNRGYGGYHSDFAEIQTELSNDDLIAIGLTPGRIRISHDGGETFDEGYMLVEDYYSYMNFYISKFIYTEDAIYLLGYDQGSDKGIRFGKIFLKGNGNQTNENKSIRIANSEKGRQLNIPEHPGLLDNSTTQFTISFWYKYECAEGQESKTREFIRKHSEYQPVFSMQMIYGGVRASIRTDKEHIYTPDGGKVIARKWQHYTLTYNADATDPNIIMYLDGVPVAESFTTGYLVNDPGVILFGLTSHNAEDIYYFDDMSIWNRALEPTEVKELALNRLTNIEKEGLLYYSDFNGTMYDEEHDINGLGLTAEYSDDVPNPPIVNFDAVLNRYELLCVNKTKDSESSDWFFGDGKSSDLANPSHTYKNHGEYNVRLTTSNETTVFSAFEPITIAGLSKN